MNGRILFIALLFCFVFSSVRTVEAKYLTKEVMQAIRGGKVEGMMLIEDKFVLEYEKSKLNNEIITSNISLETADGTALLIISKDNDTGTLSLVIGLNNKDLKQDTFSAMTKIPLGYMIDDSKIMKDVVSVQEGGIYFVKNEKGKVVDYGSRFIQTLIDKKRLAIRIKVNSNIYEEVFDIEGIEKAIRALEDLK